VCPGGSILGGTFLVRRAFPPVRDLPCGMLVMKKCANRCGMEQPSKKRCWPVPIALPQSSLWLGPTFHPGTVRFRSGYSPLTIPDGRGVRKANADYKVSSLSGTTRPELALVGRFFQVGWGLGLLAKWHLVEQSSKSVWRISFALSRLD